MTRLITVQRQSWLHHKPPKARDIRQLHSKFWTLSKADQERQRRIVILRAGGDEDRHLAAMLSKAKPRKSAQVMCCPIAARRFQIFFCSRAIKITTAYGHVSFALTLVDPTEAVPFEKIEQIDWRKLHLQMRRRLERCVGKDVVVFGMGEVEADYERRVWQPHYHLMVFGSTSADLETLRNKHYSKDEHSVRKMKVIPLPDAGWYAYLSKLIAFRKIVVVGSDGRKRVSRKRLKNQEFCQYMRYLAKRQPTAFLFCLNCSILKTEHSRT